MKNYIMNKVKGYVGRSGQARKMKPLTVSFTDTGAFAIRPHKNIRRN